MDEKIKKLIEDLENNNTKVRLKALKALGEVAYHEDISAVIPKLGDLLTDKNKDIVQEACLRLAITAYRGADIALVIPQLKAAILNRDSDVGRNAAGALARYYANKKNWNELNGLLKHEEEPARLMAAKFLTLDYINKKQWKKVNEFLNNKDLYIQRGALASLDKIHDKTDLSFIIPIVIKLLSDKNVLLRRDAVISLGLIAFNKVDISPAISSIAKLVLDKNKRIRWRACQALYAAAQNGLEISVAIPNLTKRLIDGKSDVGACAVTLHYINKKQWDEVKKLLNHKNKRVRDSVPFAIELAKRRGAKIDQEILKKAKEITAEEMVKERFGDVGLKVWNLIDGARTTDQIMKETGVSDLKLVEILNFLEDQGLIKLENKKTLMKTGYMRESFSQTSSLDRLILEKFGTTGLNVYNLIDGARTTDQIMKETGVTEKKLESILNFLEDKGIIKMEKPKKK